MIDVNYISVPVLLLLLSERETVCGLMDCVGCSHRTWFCQQVGRAVGTGAIIALESIRMDQSAL